MNVLEHRIPPPIVTVVTGAVMWAIARYTPQWSMNDLTRLTLVGACIIAGFTLLLAGMRAFRRASTTIDPVNIEEASVLVTTGVYRISRNPMYVGLMALLCAWAAYLSAPWALAGVLFFTVFLSRFQILPEERVMRIKFGQAYEDYLGQVRRWL